MVFIKTSKQKNRVEKVPIPKWLYLVTTINFSLINNKWWSMICCLWGPLKSRVRNLWIEAPYNTWTLIPWITRSISVLSFFPLPSFFHLRLTQPMAEFKEFERRFKFKPRLKYGCFHLKLYQMYQDLSRRLI